VPGQPVVLRVDSNAGPVEVTSADGRRVERLTRTSQGTFVANETGTTGIYHARWGDDGKLAFAVNQFDLRESDLAPRGLVPEGVPPRRPTPTRSRSATARSRAPRASSRAARTGGNPWRPGTRRRPARVVHLQSPRLYLRRVACSAKSGWPKPLGWPTRPARGRPLGVRDGGPEDESADLGEAAVADRVLPGDPLADVHQRPARSEEAAVEAAGVQAGHEDRGRSRGDRTWPPWLWPASTSRSHPARRAGTGRASG
jgi:hypothetical protein